MVSSSRAVLRRKPVGLQNTRDENSDVCWDAAVMPANLRVQISSTFSVKTVSSLRVMSSAELNSVGIFKYKRLWPRKVL